MQTCQECGNHDVRVVDRAGAVVHECGLCGASFGDRAAVRSVSLADEAASRGVAAGLWPLARVLERLRGFGLGACSEGSAGGWPSFELVVEGQEALVELENLAKSMRLAAGGLRCRWSLEVRFEQALVVVVQAGAGLGSRRDAGVDVDALAQQLERDMRLSWWRSTTRQDLR